MAGEPPKKRYDPRGDPFGGHHVGEPKYPKGQGVPRPMIGSENLGSGQRQRMAAVEQHEVLKNQVKALNREVQEKGNSGFPPTDEQLSRIRRLREQQVAARRLM